MGLLDKAKGLADQAMAKADEAMTGAATGGVSKQATPYLRDLGVLAYLEASGRPAPDTEMHRERCTTALEQLERQGPLDFSMGSVAPPPPPPPGAAGAVPPPPAPGTVAPPPAPGTVAPPPAPGTVAPPPAPGAVPPPPPPSGS